MRGVILKIQDQKDGKSSYNYKVVLEWSDLREIMNAILPE